MNGQELIKYHAPDIPELPGTYFMKSANKNILYIGKAKNLKNRLLQYTSDLDYKNKIMIPLVYYLEYTVTDSESSALLLEAQLIRRFKPKFNILLKDDKSFPYIKLRLDHDYPQLLKYKSKEIREKDLFGPFASSHYVDITLTELQKLFKLRSCTDSYFASRKRPCLQYQIKRCSAPCVNKISKSDYNDLITELKAFFAGKDQKLQHILAGKMQTLSDNLQFEDAAKIRNRIKALSYIQSKSDATKHLKDSDVIVITSKNGEFCVQLFIYRFHQSCGNQVYFFRNTEFNMSYTEILGNFIMQLYQNNKPPKEILTNCELDNPDLYLNALQLLHKNKNTIKLSIPKRGAKYQIIQNALYNAKIKLENHLKKFARNAKILTEIQKLLNLQNFPKRIEVYDNSHIQGAFAIGAMIVAGINGFEKKEYRLFNIKGLFAEKNIPDDYAMLREVLTRRIKRLQTEINKIPDLMIIDGGKGHMKIVLQVMDELNLNIPFVCMSKGMDRNAGNEKFHLPYKESFTMDKNLQIMKYLQILRDEAHNFAITSHRRKRSNAIKRSSLDSIQGIGAIRKKALLNYFGSFQAISDATIEELVNIKGINLKLAKIIYDLLH